MIGEAWPESPCAEAKWAEWRAMTDPREAEIRVCRQSVLHRAGSVAVEVPVGPYAAEIGGMIPVRVPAINFWPIALAPPPPRTVIMAA